MVLIVPLLHLKSGDFRVIVEKVRREVRWTPAGETPARELVRWTATALTDQRPKREIDWLRHLLERSKLAVQLVLHLIRQRHSSRTVNLMAQQPQLGWIVWRRE